MGINDIFLVHHSHTDFGYTDEAERVAEQQMGYLETALDLIDTSRNKPAAEQFFWTVECSRVAEWFCDRHGSTGRKRLLAALECGQLEVAGFSCQPITHLQHPLELRANFVWADRLYREIGQRCRTAMLTDLGSLSWALPEIAADFGIELILLGQGSFRVRTPFSTLPPLFHWEGPSGHRVLVRHYPIQPLDAMLSGSGNPLAPYGWGKTGFLWPARVARLAQGESVHATPIDSLLGKAHWPEVHYSTFAGRITSQGYPLSTILIQAGSDNGGPDPNLAADIAWLNQHSGMPWRVEAGTPRQFLDTIKPETSRLPILRGDLHCSWSDQCGSLAMPTARYREAARNHRAAVALAGDKPAVPDGSETRLMENLLAYSDHTFGLSAWGFAEAMDGGFGPWDSLSELHENSWLKKSTYAHSAWSESRNLLTRQTSEIALRTECDFGVVNTMKEDSDPAWIESVVASPTPVTAWRTANGLLPVQSESVSPNWQRIWIKAPALGGGQILEGELQYEADAQSSGEITGATHTASNLSQNAGPTSAFTSGWEPEPGHQILDLAAKHQFAEILHAEVDGVDRRLVACGMNWPIERHFSRAADACGETHFHGPLFHRVRRRQSLTTRSGASISTSTEIFHFSDPTEQEVRIWCDKPALHSREDLRIAFPFAGKLLDVALDVGGHTTHWNDFLDGSHTGWLTVGDWIALATDQGTIGIAPLDAPLFEVGGMTAENWRGGALPGNAHVYSYAMNNLYPTNIPQWQQGRFLWRYRLKWFAGTLQPAAIRRWAGALSGGLQAIRPARVNP